jgi:hypothetical protein
MLKGFSVPKSPFGQAPTISTLSAHGSGRATSFSEANGEQVTLATGDECCRSEWANGPPMSKAGSRKRVEHRDLWIGWHFPEAD